MQQDKHVRKIIRKYAYRYILLMAIIIVACAPNAPESTHFNKATRIADDIITENLMQWVEQLAEAHLNDIPVDCAGYESADLFPACELTRDAAVRLVSEAFTSMGYKPDTVAVGQGSLTAKNIVAEWPGTRPNDVVLLGAHLDAFYAGADDNGSAIAALLEIARAVRKHSFHRTIRFVAFDLEEFGAIGSTGYVEEGYANDVTSAIILDLIGYASSAPNSQDDVMGTKLPDVGDFLLVAGNQASKDMTQKTVQIANGGLARFVGLVAPGDGTYFLSSVFMRSDHGMFWYKNIPTIFLTDTANFRNPNYHKPTDTPDTLDPDFLARNTRAIAAAVALFAEVQL